MGDDADGGGEAGGGGIGNGGRVECLFSQLTMNLELVMGVEKRAKYRSLRCGWRLWHISSYGWDMIVNNARARSASI